MGVAVKKESRTRKVYGKFKYGASIKRRSACQISKNEVLLFDITSDLDHVPIRRFWPLSFLWVSSHSQDIIAYKTEQKPAALMRDPCYISNLSEIKFRVPDLNVACKDRCDAVTVDCFIQCGDHSACRSECARENTECISSELYHRFSI